MAYPHDPWTHTPQPTTRSRGGGRSGGRGTRSVAAACAWLAALAVVVALTVGHTSLPTVDAAFSARTSSQVTVSTATLAAPTGLTTSRTCPSASTPPVRKQFSASNSGAGAAQVTTVTPADAAAGDVLIAYVTVANSSGNAAATGWSIAAQTNGDGMSMTALYLRLESAPAPSHTFTWQDGTAGTVFLVAYGGADPFSPIATMNATWGTGTTATAATITAPRTPGSVVLALGTTGAGDASAPSGLTRRYSGTNAGVTTGMTVWEGTVSSAGTTPAYTSTLPTSRAWRMIPLFVKPPTTAAGASVVTLTWTSPSAPVGGFMISRSDGATATVPGSATTWDDSANTATTAYTYSVRAAAGAWTSAAAAVWQAPCP